MVLEQSRVRFGLVGCGRVGATADETVGRWAVGYLWLPFCHASAITAVDEAELVAVCDVNEAAARDATRRYQASSYYLDYREMLERERLDAVAVATRTDQRRAIIEESVRNRVKAIYCEKPLSNTLEDADYLASLLERSDVFFVYGTRRRYMPIYQQVRELVSAGEIGELTTIVVRFGYSLLFWGHPHSVDIASFFAGDAEVDYVQADLDLDASWVRGSLVDADPMIRMAYIKFTNGISAHIVASDSFDVDLSGTNGMACIRSDGHSARWRRRLSGSQDDGWLLAESIVPAHDTSSGTVNSIRALTRAVLEGKDPNYNIRLAVRNQEVLFGFLHSHLQGGGKVHLPVERRNIRITGRYGNLFA